MALVLIAVLELALFGAYLLHKDLYLISWWKWGVAATALVCAVWGSYAWGWLDRMKGELAVALLATATFVGLVGQQTWAIIFPVRFEPQVFGIAVAELGEGADFSRSLQAREISGQVYEYLCQELGSEASDAPPPCGNNDQVSKQQSIVLRKIGVVKDSYTAQMYAQRIGAEIVIWGQIVSSQQGEATIYFQVSETFDRAVTPDRPIVLPVVNRSTDIIIPQLNLESDPIRLKALVAQQSKLMLSFALGLESFLNRRFSEAAAQFGRVAKVIEQNQSNQGFQVSAAGKSQIYFYLGTTYHALGQIDTGRKWLKLAQDAEPREPANLLSLALGYASQGQSQERDDHLRQAFNLIGDWLITNPDDDAATYDRAIIHEIRGEYQDAIWDYETVIERNPKNYYIAYIGLGRAAAKSGQLELSEKALRAAIDLANETGTNASWAHLNLALVYETNQKPEAARVEFGAAIALDPDVDAMYYYYAQFLDLQQEVDAAEQAYRKMVEVTKNKGWAYGKLAAFYLKHHLIQKALENYQRSVHEEPSDALMRTYLAETYFTVGNTDAALQEFQEAVEIDVKSYYIYASYARHLFLLNKFETAAQMYERSLELRPIHYAALFGLARTYEELSRCDEAKQLYTHIISLTDQFNNDQIGAARDRLQAVDTSCH